MVIYLSIFISCIILYIFYNDNLFKIISNEIVLFMICIIFICITGFRYDMGTDYWSYYRVFNQESGVIEFGFIFLIKVYKIFSDSYDGFVFLIAFLSIFIKYLFFRKLENPFLALIIYIAIFSVNLDNNGIRQGLAASFVFHSVYWALKRNILLSFLFTAIASSIHISSLIFIPVYFIVSKDNSIKVKNVFVILIISLFIRFYLMDILLPYIISFFGNFSGIAAIGRLLNYFKLKLITTLELGAIRRIFMCIMYIFINNKKVINNNYFILYLFSTLINILFMGHSILSYRLSLVFDIFLVPLFADKKITYNFRNKIIIIPVIILSFILYIMVLHSEHQRLIPYKTYIFNIL